MDRFDGNKNDYNEDNQDYDNNEKMNSYVHQDSANIDAMDGQGAQQNEQHNDDEFDEYYETPYWSNESFYIRQWDGFI